MFFVDDGGVKQSLPVGWTGRGVAGCVVAVAGGRSPFRVDDLVALADLIAQLSSADLDRM